MEFQSLGMTIVNAGMIMAAVLILREKMARNKRKDADSQDLILDLSEWDKTRIPFYKRKSRNVSLIGLSIIGIFLIWLGFRNIQVFFESLVMGLVAGSFVMYLRKVDERKSIGVYSKGILHNTGFLYFTNIAGYQTTESDEYANASDVWLMIGNVPKVQVQVSSDQVKSFEKLIRKHAQIKK